jgi:DegV family protein with EDD domain
MPRIHIVTDSSVRFTHPEIFKGDLITLAPVTFRSGDKTVVDSPTLPNQDATILYDAIGQTPLISAASTEEIITIYNRLQKETKQILSIHTSSSLSEAYQSATQASEHFLGRCDIQVIDSQTLSVGLGFLVQTAYEASKSGVPFDEIVRLIRGMIPRIYMVFYLDDMFYLERNQQVNRSQAILGNMLGIIPFLTVENGKLALMEKVRARPRAIEKLIEFVSEFTDMQRICILFGGWKPDEDAFIIEERLSMLYPDLEVSHINYGPYLASYIGLHSVGVVVLEGETDGS